jgi:colanic acid biosynthesis glycosyl transferase WcaI
MRIIVWGINYTPEVTGIAPFNRGLCEFLHSAGHDVCMVSSFAYYPAWRKAAADSGRLFRTDFFAGVPVHRCWHFVPSKVTAVRRILHELSFALTSTLRILSLHRAEVYVVVSPPLLLGPCAWLVSRLKRSRYVFHVQDLQPDAALGLGMLEPGCFTRMLYSLEAWAYRGACAVSGISAGMLTAFEKKGVPAGKRWYFPNWTDGAPLHAPEGAAEQFRACHGIPREALLVIYSGNIGKKQGLEIVVEAAKVLRDWNGESVLAPVRILIIGDGAARSSLAAELERDSLLCVRLLPLLGSAEFLAALSAMDVGLITQAAGTGQYFFPSKLLTLLSAGRPVVTVADETSELAKAVADGGFGLNVLPGRAAELAEALRLLAADRGQLTKMAAETIWVRQFSRERVLAEYVGRLREIALPEISRAPY